MATDTAWRAHAKCDDPNEFVFESGTYRNVADQRRIAECIAICNTCPVKVECANWALLVEDPLVGAVLGGMGPAEIWQKRNTPEMIDARRFLNRRSCGTEHAYNTHLYFGEICQACRDAHTRRNNPQAA